MGRLVSMGISSGGQDSCLRSLPGWSSLVEEDRILIDDDLEASDESFGDSKINHEVKRLLLVGLPREDQGSIVLLEMLVLQMRNHLAREEQVARDFYLSRMHVAGCVVIQIVVAIPVIPNNVFDILFLSFFLLSILSFFT